MRSSKLKSPWAYFALVFVFSWGFTIPIALSGAKLGESPALMVLYGVAGLGPAICAILLISFSQGREGFEAYWRRIVDFRRISLRWYGVILLTVPTLTALAALVDRLMGGQGFQWEAAADFVEQPVRILPFMLFILLFGPLPEELGWRGYVLDRLQAKGSALASSLVLGIAWALWHVPQFFIDGTYQHGLGVGTTAFWTFLFALVAGSILYTWIYNNTGRVVLSAILFHFMQNFTGEMVALTARADLINFLLTVVLAAVVVILWRPETLTKRPWPRGWFRISPSSRMGHW